jgi:hypothetical protein
MPGGESGIRTHGALRHTRFRVVRLRPDSAISPYTVYILQQAITVCKATIDPQLSEKVLS